MTSSLTTTRFAAFAEADLLSGGDWSLGKGDAFTMPAASTSVIEVRDDDDRLSGDRKVNEKADDGWGQKATITVSGDQAFGDARIYAEKIWTIEGEGGATYELVEIEVQGAKAPGRGDDFFAFLGAVPKAGEALKIVGGRDAGGVAYADLGADPAPAAATGAAGAAFIMVEAEDMTRSGGFSVEHGAKASGGELVRLDEGHEGALSTVFSGETGVYDLTIHAQDETDGVSDIEVFVDGAKVGAVRLDRQSDGGGSNDGGFSAFTLEGVSIPAGAEVKLVGFRDGYEYVRIDKIAFTPAFEPAAPPEGSVECAIDFDGAGVDGRPIEAGDVVSSLDGVSIRAVRSQDLGDADPRNAAMIFDTNNPTGGDDDLATSTQNNVLIISEDFDSSDPDDNAAGTPDVSAGGVIFFDFDEPVFVQSLSYIEFNFGGVVEALDASGAVVKRVDVADIGDNNVGLISIGADGVSQLQVTLRGSGAIDDLVFFKPEAAPEPGAIEGRYFLDANRNDQDDDGANGVEGKTVMLFEADGTTPAKDIDGNAVAAVLTAADGAYSFSNLAAGDYVVMFEDGAAEGRSFVDANIGSDAADSDVDPSSGKTAAVAVAAGETTIDVDAGVEEEPGQPGDLCIEAEDFQLSGGFSVEHGDQASDGRLVRLDQGATGALSAEFNGESGRYDISVFAQDETDGVSSIKVLIDGVEVGEIALDRQSDGGGS
ncbi:MAG: SdrD B-like domain-containing protein, partial [Pseudomonadota bacterium]